MARAAAKFADEIEKPPVELFSYQFALLPKTKFGLDGFLTRPFGARSLLHCPKLAVAMLTDANGQDIGVCLGIAIDTLGRRVDNGYSLRVGTGSPNFWLGIEEFAIGLAGRWLLIVRDDTDDTRVFGDASGMYNCVYDPLAGGIGSTLLLSLLRDIEQNPAVDYTRTATENARLPFGHTRDIYAKRLAVNHYLRLTDWSETRFWPKTGDICETESGTEGDVIAALCDRLAAIFSGIVTSVPSSVGITGGNDSRNMVAAGKASLGHVRQFFTWTHGFNSRLDYRSASLVMSKLGFDLHRFETHAEPFTPEELSARTKAHQVSTGFAVGPHQFFNKNYSTQPDPGCVVLTGNVMEALRAAHWRNPRPPAGNYFKFGLKRCLFVQGQSFDSAFVQKWLPDFKSWWSSLPEDAQKLYIDMLFVEHNLPNLGAMFFGYQSNFFMSPFNDRRIVSLCSKLSLSYRYSKLANRDFLAHAAPELKTVPFVDDIRADRKRAS